VGSVQQARDALGLRLRELRLDARLSGRQLAERLAWPASKVSKIELGRQTPTESDIHAWADATAARNAAPDLIASLRTLETLYAEWRRQFRTGARARQLSILQLETSVSVIRAFEPALIPGLLQTPDYARQRFAENLAIHQGTDDVDAAVQVRMERQQILYRSGRRFHFVLAEAALRHLLCPPPVMAGQLDRLVTLSAMHTVHLGILPFSRQLPVAPKNNFWIYDDRVVLVETIAAELTLAQPQEIAFYAAVFARLAEVAVYGSEARALIGAALAALPQTES